MQVQAPHRASAATLHGRNIGDRALFPPQPPPLLSLSRRMLHVAGRNRLVLVGNAGTALHRATLRLAQATRQSVQKLYLTVLIFTRSDAHNLSSSRC